MIWLVKKSKWDATWPNNGEILHSLNPLGTHRIAFKNTARPWISPHPSELSMKIQLLSLCTNAGYSQWAKIFSNQISREETWSKSNLAWVPQPSVHSSYITRRRDMSRLTEISNKLTLTNIMAYFTKRWHPLIPWTYQMRLSLKSKSGITLKTTCNKIKHRFTIVRMVKSSVASS